MKKLITIPLMMFFFACFSQDTYKLEDEVTDFSLKNINDELVSLASLENAKGAIIIFTCNHCPYAKLYEERIIELDKIFASKGYPVVAINPNDPIKQPEDSFENMKVRASEKGFTFPYLFDETQQVAKSFGANKTPHVFIVQKKESDFMLKYIGAIDDNPQNADGVEVAFVNEAVNALIKGEKPPHNNTRAIGCTIKWK